MNAKRNLIQICLLGVVLLTLPAVVQAQFTFITNADNTITITGYSGPPWAVNIPTNINGLSVTSIGNGAFYNYLGEYFLTSVTIPNNVTNIGVQAFNECYQLTNVTIGNSVVNIGDHAFYQCTRLTSMTIPDSVTNIGCWTFFNCARLTSITISSSLASITEGAFEDCIRLTNVSIPSSVTSIGAVAFNGCSSLANVTISNGVTSIGDSVFSGCTKLMAITVDTNNPAYSSMDGVLFNKSQTTLIVYPGGKAGIYTVPNSVTSIGNYAFKQSSGLTSVTIGTNVTSLGWSVFYQCGSLTGVYFQGNAPSIGPNSFYGDNNTTIYYLPWTTGWNSLTGYIIAPWLPQVQISDASFGVRTNQFGFNIDWASGQTVVVETCTNLANPDWLPVGTNILTGGSSYFSDPQWMNYPGRFYRLRSL